MARATRLTDLHQCNATAPAPHLGGPVQGPGAATVLTGYLPQARAGDACACAGPPDFIVTGSATVMIDGMNAARQGDRTMHQPAGTVVMGFDTVDIGGPTVGVVLGGTRAGTCACVEAAATRHPPPGVVTRDGGSPPSGTTQQSYGNCGLESARQIINAVHPPGLTQEQLLTQAQTTTGVPPGRWRPRPLAVTRPIAEDNGGTWPWSQRAILEHNGVRAELEEPTLANVAQAVAEGRAVIANLDASVLWDDDETPPGAWHSVLVTGARYSAAGELEELVINDTGAPPPYNCGVAYPAATIDAAMDAFGGQNVATSAPVWRR